MAEFKDSYALLDHYIKNDNLKKHCYAVESAMKYYAGILGEDTDKWGKAGLLHDLDWELFPDTHPNTAVPILEKEGIEKDVIEAILGHAYPDRTDIPRSSLIAKHLFERNLYYNQAKKTIDTDAKSPEEVAVKDGVIRD